MLYLLAQFEDVFGPFRLFEYVTFRAGGALFTAMFIGLIMGPLTVKLLKNFNTNAPTRLAGLVDEKFIDRNKDKTPSMGGILLVFSVIVSLLLWGKLSNPLLLVFLSTLAVLALLGFIDDFSKVVYGRRDGIPGKLKLAFQLAIGVIAVFYLDIFTEPSGLMRELMLPFVKKSVYSGSIVMFLGALTMVASSNAVNLTDGKDGLAVGCSIFCALAYAAIAYLCGHKFFAEYLQVPFIPGCSEVVVFASALTGGCMGFLWYNCHPASMFMGDTGSLALGGSIGLIAVLVKQELLLIIIGGIFVIEAGSVILQVASFKLRGKRIFLCTPIHHHFEQKNWPETQIVIRFWIIAGFLALLGLATLKLR